MLDANLTLMNIFRSDVQGTLEEGVSVQGSLVVGKGSIIKSRNLY